MPRTRISVLFILLVVNSCITIQIIDRNAISVDLRPFWNFLPLHKNISKGDFIEYRISATTNDKLPNFFLKLNKKLEGRLSQKIISIKEKQIKVRMTLQKFIGYDGPTQVWSYYTNAKEKVTKVTLYQNGQSYPLSIAKKGDLRFVEPKSITIGKNKFKIAVPHLPESNFSKLIVTQLGVQHKMVLGKKMEYINIQLKGESQVLGNIEYQFHINENLPFLGALYWHFGAEKTGMVHYDITNYSHN